MWLDGHVNVSDKVRAKEKRLDFLSDLSEAMRFQEAQVLICAGKSDIVVLIERTRQLRGRGGHHPRSGARWSRRKDWKNSVL